MTKFIYSFGIILFGLSLGYLIQVLVRGKRIGLPIHIDDLRKLLQRIALLFLNPIAIVGAIWVVSLKSVALIALPFIGLSALLAGGVMALGTILLLTSIGLALRFRKVRDYLKECISVATIKFFLVPILAITAAYMIGFGDMGNGLPLKVVMILASMPVAFNALIPPSIYDLDLDLANSCWFFTTALLVFVLPILLIVITSV